MIFNVGDIVQLKPKLNANKLPIGIITSLTATAGYQGSEGYIAVLLANESTPRSIWFRSLMKVS